MSENELTRYPGKSIDVQWDGRLCIHIGECGQAKGDLFVGGRQPWCQPDLVPGDNVEDVVTRCPTGALSYHYKDGSRTESPASENTILVANNGPLYVRGDIEIDGAPDDAPGVKFRAALCRCGLSRNKPFCDNSHEAGEFRDNGAIGETGEATIATGGKLSITPLQDGPLLAKGNVTLTSGSGRVAWQGTQVALCRCGASKNKPFCDGTHKVAGFKS